MAKRSRAEDEPGTDLADDARLPEPGKQRSECVRRQDRGKRKQKLGGPARLLLRGGSEDLVRVVKHYRTGNEVLDAPAVWPGDHEDEREEFGDDREDALDNTADHLAERHITPAGD